MTQFWFHPTIAGRIFALVWNNGDYLGFWRSTDDGASFSRVGVGLEERAVADLEFDPWNPEVMLLSPLGGYEQSGIFRSTDGGATLSRVWTPAYYGVEFSFASDPKTPGKIYAYDGSVLESFDHGASWTPLPPPLWQRGKIAWNSTLDELVFYGRGVLTSRTGGRTWTSISDNLPGRFQDVSSLGIDQRNGNMLAGTKFGVYQLGGIGCRSNATTLCLNENRFRVHASFRTASGISGAAKAVSLTSDSGYFWFFNDANDELVVKLVDACGLPAFENFWVFATGLTNVEVRIVVVDTVSGATRIYDNALNHNFEPILDTGSFGVCDLQASLAPSANTPQYSHSSDSAEGACVPGGQTLCLNRGRFAVDIDWTTQAGTSGAWHAVPQTAASGFFWFCDDANVELVVKVMDGCC